MPENIRKHGRMWYIRYSVTDEETGRRRQKEEVAGTTERAARNLLKTRLSEIQRGTYTEPNKQTVGEFLDHWLTAAAGRLGERTRYRYAEIIRLHIKPTFGAKNLQALRAVDIQGLYTRLLENGRADGRGGLSAQSVLHVHRLLHEALDQAEKWDMIPRNPAKRVDPPTVRRRETKTWGKEEFTVVLGATEGEWLYIPLLLALGTGMRAGEILALQWGDIDLPRGVVTVQRSASVANNRADTPIVYKAPKTNRARSVTLPTSLTVALSEHLKKQSEYYVMLGKEHTPAALVVSEQDGTGVKTHILSKRFENLIRRIGLPRIRFHDLRHSHATALLSSGENIKTISERLGHANVTLTLNTYAHVTASMQCQAARTAETFLARERKPIRMETAETMAS